MSKWAGRFPWINAKSKLNSSTIFFVDRKNVFHWNCILHYFQYFTQIFWDLLIMLWEKKNINKKVLFRSNYGSFRYWKKAEPLNLMCSVVRHFTLWRVSYTFFFGFLLTFKLHLFNFYRVRIVHHVNLLAWHIAQTRMTCLSYVLHTTYTTIYLLSSLYYFVKTLNRKIPTWRKKK